MKNAMEQCSLTPRDQAAVQGVMDGITALAQFLRKNSVPVDPNADDLYVYLSKMKQRQGNTASGVSMIACILAKRYLDAHLKMKPFDATKKKQSAPGLDIDECTVTGMGGRVVGEIKTTVPCGAKNLGGQRDLGAQQKAMF